MAPNPRVAKAFRAMRDLGIPEEKTKPVLKKLIKLYEKNWELIEEENYRALADAIFDSQESEEVEQKKKLDVEAAEKKKRLEQAECLNHIEEETQVQEEPERPLKRLRLRHQDSQPSPSSINPSSNSNGTLLKVPKLEANEASEPVSPLKRKGKQPILPNDMARVEGNDVIESGDVVVADVTGSYSAIRRLRDRGKEPISPHSGHREKRSVKSSDVHLKVPKIEPGVKKNLALIIPKDEPITDVPLAVILPETLTNGDASTDNHVEETSNETNGHELMNIQDQSTAKVDIASSSSGEIKISLSCRKTKLSLTNVDTLLKTMEEKCLKSYKVLDPNFSVKKLMKDMCDCFLELGSNSTNDPPTEPSGTCANGKGMPSVTENNGDKKVEQNGIENTESFDDVIDIAKGQERVIISLVNEVNSECPPSFHYIPRNAVFQSAYVDFSLARIADDNCCPTCYGDCLTSSTPCPCAIQSGGKFAYTTDGLVKEELLDECIKMNRDPQKRVVDYCKECPLERSKNEEILEQCKGHLERSFIKECWLKCGCNKKCGNRVVQCGIKYKLQVFMTSGGKGWGVRTLEELPKGAFVCEYVGEVLTNMELYNRVSQSLNKDKYAHPVLLDADWGGETELKEEEALCLDATYYGNVARFINHRCFDSNLLEIPVEVENPDRHYYHLAFFTTRKVKALEELTRDYGIDFDDDDHPVKAFRCQCGSRYCRDIKPSTRSGKRRISSS
ncbi:hypothetical protein L2E82_13001 [Cichorium intybus]|uniref:Uncharacterized protein n=1 Tax=Cichorium intybus TaxID=13427 RepID=A0ACB9GHM0_CICIN|nr:hypothetical protein L2E82_13001 [Cichorium intybus]